MKNVIRKPPSEKHTHYVDKPVLLEAMSKHREAVLLARADGKQPPRANDYIGSCILKICHGLSMNRHFVRYTQHWKEEMVYDAVENCSRAIDNFDPKLSNNAFGYFTQIAFNAFLRRIDKERRHQYIKHKSFESSGMYEYVLDEMITHATEHNEISSGIVEAYEATIARRLQKRIDKNEQVESQSEQSPRPGRGFRRRRKVVEQGEDSAQRPDELSDEGGSDP